MPDLTKQEKDAVVKWLVKCGKIRKLARYHPDYFIELLNDNSDNRRARDIIIKRYKNEPPMSFKEIANSLNISERDVYEYHKQVLDSVIHGKK